jgi:5-methylthioadenosine/S-adenosylhomocysteine deaminase
MPTNGPIDPHSGPKLALAGRVVTMDPGFAVIDRGVVYIDAGRVVAAQPRNAPAPAGFDGVAVTNSDGTIFPGLIELHNHLAYNALTLWAVPKRYTNRDQWSGTPEYRKLVSGPMKVVGSLPDLLPAAVRYVECKCLLGGVTTTQGLALFSNAGARRFYRGVVRNVEQTDDVDLPEADTKIADVDAGDADRFLTALRRASCFLLHLSEGTDARARAHFLALKLADGRWAVTDSLAGIHCVALKAEDFAVMAEVGAAMIWSPLSNLLLYGQTADIRAAKGAGLRIGLGSDWSPSGSKNLLGELKAARVASHLAGDVFSDREVVAMATRNAAAILKWQAALGSIEPGKRADLLVIDGAAGDPYAALIEAKETAIRLVMINGVARYGLPALMTRLGAAPGESIRVGGKTRQLFLDRATEDPDVRAITLKEASRRLADAFGRLPELAGQLERQPQAFAAHAFGPIGVEEGPVVWRLALDELAPTGVDLRPRLPLAGTHALTGPARAAAAAARPLSEVLEPIPLDPLTVADDPKFLTSLSGQINLPAGIKDGIRALY